LGGGVNKTKKKLEKGKMVVEANLVLSGFKKKKSEQGRKNLYVAV